VTGLTISKELIGRTVRCVARPEWGNGNVLTIKPATMNGRPVHRVSIQFATGHRVLMVPPAILIGPEALSEPEIPATWIETIAGRTPDDRLRLVPASATEVLGSPTARVAALAPYYEIDPDDEKALLRWARGQSGIPDPLVRWTRDELQSAFRAFCTERDDHLRGLLATAKQARGQEAVDEALSAASPRARYAMLEVLRRPI
jgi:hypothetical protein